MGDNIIQGSRPIGDWPVFQKIQTSGIFEKVRRLTFPKRGDTSMSLQMTVRRTTMIERKWKPENHKLEDAFFPVELCDLKFVYPTA